MCLTVILGVLGFLSAEFITIMGGYAMLDVMKYDTPFSLTNIFMLKARREQPDSTVPVISSQWRS